MAKNTKAEKLSENKAKLQKLDKNLAETSAIIAETVARLKKKKDDLIKGIGSKKEDTDALDNYRKELEKFITQAQAMRDQLAEDVEAKKVKKFDPKLMSKAFVDVGKEIDLLSRTVHTVGSVLSAKDPDKKELAIATLSQVKKEIQQHRGRDWHGIARGITLIVGIALISAFTFPLSGAAAIAYLALAKKIEQPSAFRFHSLVSKLSKKRENAERVGMFTKPKPRKTKATEADVEVIDEKESLKKSKK